MQRTRTKCTTHVHSYWFCSLNFLLSEVLVTFAVFACFKPCQTRTHCCRHKCFPVYPRAQHLLRTQILCPGNKKCFWFCSETFCVRNKCFPVCARKETSWARASFARAFSSILGNDDGWSQARARRLVKKDLYFTFEFCNHLPRSVHGSTSIGLKSCSTD